MTEQITMGVAFAAGLASFLSPCVLPLVPVYLASLAGPEILEATSKQRRGPIFLHSLSFVMGFAVVFSLWGAGAGLIGSALIDYSSIIDRVVGILLIAFGVVILASLRVPWLNFERRLNLSLGTTSGYLRSFLTGSIFTLAWTPCLGWQIAGILALAGSSGTAWQGTYLLAVYSLGLGLPFLIVGAAFDAILPLLKSINRHSRWIYVVSGVLLIAVGILVVTGRLVWLNTVLG